MPSNTGNEPVAIIGSGCRFPGSSSTPSKLWSLLSEPHDVISEIPRTRFNPHGFYHSDGEYSGHSNVLHSYILDEDHRAWDADFFSVSANEASAIDPQQRLLMECVYEALETGGQKIGNLRGSDTAVYVGLMCEEYSDIQARELNTIPTVRDTTHVSVHV
jgi:hybrid polyketide synthase/nonribosomal peptide synthetase ACE1